jgi:uncharacterized protein YecE (DUF72 family)
MQFLVGTSGYSYPKWKGSFYPPKMKPSEMLPYYAEHFATVEMNNTFYKLPEPSAAKEWASQVPAEFRFALKAPQTITHRKRLKDAAAPTKAFLKFAANFKQRRGPLLFQLPPNMKKDLGRLEAFLKLLRKAPPAAFEFRHASWFDDETYDCLRAHHCALCCADTDDKATTKLVGTTTWGYVRLRRETYSDAQLRKWIQQFRAQSWDQAYVYFKHEDTGTGPRFAARFLKLAAS